MEEPEKGVELLEPEELTNSGLDQEDEREERNQKTEMPEASKESNPPATREETSGRSKALKTVNLATPPSSPDTSQDSMVKRTALINKEDLLHTTKT